jgi:tyrosine-protein phosphatase YwqE
LLTTDVHAHLIPGIDEGSRTIGESVTMARALADLGVRRVVLTPHQFRFGNDLACADVRARTDEVRDALARASVPIEVLPGAEHYYGERLYDAVAADEELLTFDPDADGSRFLLVELPLRDPAVGVAAFAGALRRRGILPLMAHPERVSSCDVDRVREWRDAGWLHQLDLLSLVGRYGREASTLAHEALEAGLYDRVGSDLHRMNQLDSLRAAHRRFASLRGAA